MMRRGLFELRVAGLKAGNSPAANADASIGVVVHAVDPVNDVPRRLGDWTTRSLCESSKSVRPMRMRP